MRFRSRGREGNAVTREDYLAHAEECERFAAMSNLRSNRLALEASAEMWRKLAADAPPQGDVVGSSESMRSKVQE